jgi:hypothetical protein
MTHQVKAVHQIHGVAGFDAGVSPGTVFECPADQYDYLIAEGAVEDYDAPAIEQGDADAPVSKGKGKAVKADDGL